MEGRVGAGHFIVMDSQEERQCSLQLWGGQREWKNAERVEGVTDHWARSQNTDIVASVLLRQGLNFPWTWHFLKSASIKGTKMGSLSSIRVFAKRYFNTQKQSL